MFRSSLKGGVILKIMFWSENLIYNFSWYIFRKEFIVSKVINNIRDPMEDKYQGEVSNMKLVISETDRDWVLPNDGTGPLLEETKEHNHAERGSP